MKYVLGFMFGVFFLQSNFVLAQDSQSYLLSTDDVISINVFDEADLNVESAKITDDGTVSVPLLGPVQVKGKTVSEVEVLLTQLFGADYLKKPSITVTVDEYRPFYINGEVGSPGSYAFRTNMTVQMAITIAGGFTERASKSNIYLLKEKGSVRQKVTLSDQVKPGDVITVDESFF
ncbi:MAG: polysaccharide biosynthesis/export family protein [Paraglaciecola sp.]|uniref:polysaccharide biosynthesis/export family protein n=1 Tax=Paraglaciecola sp. TaxID=1920173 RepID=UPI003299461C